MWFRRTQVSAEDEAVEPESDVDAASSASPPNEVAQAQHHDHDHDDDAAPRRRRHVSRGGEHGTTTSSRRKRQDTPFKITSAEHSAIIRERKRLQAAKRTLGESRARRAQQQKNKSSRANKDPKNNASAMRKAATPTKATVSSNATSTKGNSSSQRHRRTQYRRRIMLVCAVAFLFLLLLLKGDNKAWNKSSSFHLRSSKQQQSQDTTKVYFLHASNKNVLDDKDLFSASWLQPVSTFLTFDTSGTSLQTPAAASYALFKANKERVRMTLDWLNFSVENLSTWWDTVHVLKEDGDNVAFHVALLKLHEYVRNIWVLDEQSDEDESSMSSTIAVIAFEQPLSSNSRNKPEMANQLSVASLAATTASLIQAGFGRVVIVGYHLEDSELADEAIRLLQTLVPEKNENGDGNATLLDNTNNKIRSTEIGYVQAVTEDVISAKTPINIVKGALVGLQNALKGSLNSIQQQEWLGTSSRDWKYVYLAEADTILQTKPSALVQLKTALDEGLILAPHRLQLLPHEYDLRGMKNRNKMVPAKGNFTNVTTLNPLNGAVCCHDYHKPLDYQHAGECKSFWWQCGFNDKQDHSRLEEYDLIRLEPGMNIISLAANHNGRRCKPSPSGVCLPPQPDKT